MPAIHPDGDGAALRGTPTSSIPNSYQGLGQNGANQALGAQSSATATQHVTPGWNEQAILRQPQSGMLNWNAPSSAIGQLPQQHNVAHNMGMGNANPHHQPYSAYSKGDQHAFHSNQPSFLVGSPQLPHQQLQAHPTVQVGSYQQQQQPMQPLQQQKQLQQQFLQHQHQHQHQQQQQQQQSMPMQPSQPFHNFGAMPVMRVDALNGLTATTGAHVAPNAMADDRNVAAAPAPKPEPETPVTPAVPTDGRRRSGRKRKSRMITIGRHTVLRANNYTMGEGEPSVFDRKQVYVPGKDPNRTKNAYQVFCEDTRNVYVQRGGPAVPFAEMNRHISALWSQMAPEAKQPFEVRAAMYRQQAQEAEQMRRQKWEEECKLKLAQREKEDAEHKLKKPRARKQRSDGAPRKVSAKHAALDLARTTHNKNIHRARAEAKEKRKLFMALHRASIAPFLPEKVLNAMPVLTKEQEDALKKREPDLLAPPTMKQPKEVLKKVGTMRKYQLKSLEWLLARYDQGVPCILGDEMGLGKTLQTIAFLAHLKFTRKVTGPFLCVVPLSVMSSWGSEFKRWCPKLRVVRLHSGDAAERQRLRKDVLANVNSYDVCLTTYEMCKGKEMKHTLSTRILWRMVVLDEGHRVKNETTQVSEVIRKIHSESVLLLTGTPLQNNLHELWAILNFLYPDYFTVSTPFDKGFDLNPTAARTEEEGAGAGDQANRVLVDRAVLTRAHYMLQPFMLRRLKSEVEGKLPPRTETKIYCPLTPTQLFWYKRLLLKNSTLLDRLSTSEGGSSNNGASPPENGKRESTRDSNGQEGGTDWKKLQNLMMQLRKCCNHPFLFPGAEAAVTGQEGGHATEALVEASGKLLTLDRMLARLKRKGHRVVIFSQFTRCLDIVDDFMSMRGYEYARLDGSTNRVQRMVDIAEFNKSDSPYFAFIMSTRAGGLGVNLQTADTVILLDSDWNPQADLQAMARVHRIGQTKPVHVYRFVTSGTMEERMVQRAEKKLFLSKMVNRGGSGHSDQLASLGTKELLATLTFGVDRVFKKADTQAVLSDEDIDAIIDRSPKDEDEEKQSESPSSGTTKKSSKRGKGTNSDKENKNSKRNNSSNKENNGRTYDTSELKRGQQQSLEDFDEKAMLISMRELEGQDYGKHANSSFKDIAEAWEVETLGKKRESKSRFVEVGGHRVLKLNNYSMEQGEPSVYERRGSKGKKGSKAGSSGSGSSRQLAGRDYNHQSQCLSCWKPGHIVMCDFCPASYHLDCIGLADADLEKMRFKWACPQHECHECGRKAAAVGGLLFRCEMCPKAFCEDHVPDSHSQKGFRIVNRCKRYQLLGQNHPKQACFVHCSSSCANHAKRTEGGVSYLPKASDGQVARKSAWDAMTFNAALVNEAHHTRFGKCIEGKVKPVQLGQLEGFRARLEKAHPSLVAMLFGMLYPDAEDRSEQLEDVCAWKGAKRTSEKVLAEAYLAVMRQITNTSLKTRDVAQLSELVGLRLDGPQLAQPKMVRPGVTCGASKDQLLELIAMVLALPCKQMQVFHKYMLRPGEVPPPKPKAKRKYTRRASKGGKPASARKSSKGKGSQKR